MKKLLLTLTMLLMAVVAKAEFPYATTTWGSTEPIQWYYLVFESEPIGYLYARTNAQSGDWEVSVGYSYENTDAYKWCFVQMPSGRIALVNKAKMKFLNNTFYFTLNTLSTQLDYVKPYHEGYSFYVGYDYQAGGHSYTMYLVWDGSTTYPSAQNYQPTLLYPEEASVDTYSSPAGQINFSNLDVQDENCSFTCAYSGNESHTLKVYINGTQVQNASPYTIERTNQAQEVTVSAEVFFNGNIFPMYSEKTYQVPALDEPVPEPVDQTLTPYDVYAPNNAQTDPAQDYHKLFDKDKSTKWVVDNNTGSWEAIWVDFKSNEAFIPTSYTMTTGNDTQSWSGRNPKKWKIYAKAHETDEWTTIVDVTDGAAAGLGTANTTDYSFNIDGVSSPYQYFRFEVSEVRGQGGWQNDHYVFQLAELALSGLISAEPSGDIEFSELEVYDDYCIIQASYTGDEAHTLKFFVNGTEVENPYTASRTQETQTLNVVANVEFTDPTISTITASTTYEIPALETHSWPYATTTWGSTEPIQWYYLITNNNLTSKLCVANNSGDWELRMYGAPDVDESLWCFVQMPSGRIALVNKAAMQFLNNGLDFTLDQQSFNLNYVVQNNNSNSFYICYDYQNSLYYTTTMYFNWTLGQMYPSYSSLQNMTLYAEAVTVQTYSNPAGQVNFSNLNVQDESCSFTCAYSGNESHTLKVYINGTQVENASQYTIERTNQAQEVTVSAEVFFNGNIFPMYSVKTYQVPALDEPVPEPVDQTLTPYDVYAPNNAQTDPAQDYHKLFDKDKSTKWCVDNSTGSWETIWVDFKSNEAFIPTSYTMTTGNDTQSWSGRNPKKWKIYSKAHETDEWTTIVDVTDGAAAGLGTANTTDYSFNIDGVSSPYQYFRFEVSEVRGQGGWQSDHYVFQLAELAMSGYILAVPGDSNGDSKVDVNDVTTIINYILGKNPSPFNNGNADVNGDGDINVLDVTALINIILGIN